MKEGFIVARIMTPNQELLRDYLKLSKVPNKTGLAIIIMLWEEQATEEMLDYILETKEQDPAKLYSIALKIAEKYPYEEE